MRELRAHIFLPFLKCPQPTIYPDWPSLLFPGRTCAVYENNNKVAGLWVRPELILPSPGDHDKVQRLDRRVTELAGFSSCYTVCGQTYPRKVDVQIVQALASLGATAHKVGWNWAVDSPMLSEVRC